jgi:oligopeptide transport system permease protein
LLMIVIAIVPQLFAGWFGHGDPRVCNLANSAGGPTSGHPFGFDKQGCDVYANVIYGTRDSISIGLLASTFGLVVAVVLGSVSAYYLGITDAIISRLSDVFFGFPFLLGALVLLTALKSHSVWTVSTAIALFTWPTLTRLMRASMLSAKEHDYVLAARSLGANDWRLIRRHLLPNALAPVIVISAIGIGGVIAAEATLTFLGVGLQQPAISWGLQLSDAQSDFQVHPHLLIFPALFLSLTVFSFIVLGDALEDVLDPRRNED